MASLPTGRGPGFWYKCEELLAVACNHLTGNARPDNFYWRTLECSTEVAASLPGVSRLVNSGESGDQGVSR